MKYTERDYAFITGEEFSNGRKFTISNENSKNRTRFEHLLDLTRGKRIIHFGFADHIPLISEKIKKKQWLHQLLIDNTDRNRTSPFAFTGNKFEFREVGSTANCALPMTVLNTIVADTLVKFSEEVDALIEKGDKKEIAIMQTLQKIKWSELHLEQN